MDNDIEQNVNEFLDRYLSGRWGYQAKTDSHIVPTAMASDVGLRWVEVSEEAMTDPVVQRALYGREVRGK